MERTLDFIETICRATGQRTVKVTFHGGEPLMAGHALLRQALEGLTRRFGGTGFQAALQSNLWLLDDEFCRLFVEYQVSLSTSLDGPEELTNRQRGDGYFQRTMAGLDLARGYDIPVGCIATFTPLNAERWTEVLDFFVQERLGTAIHPALPPLSRSTQDSQCHAAYFLSPERYGRLLDDMFAYYLEHRREIALSTFDHLGEGLVCGEGKLCLFKECLGMFLAIDPAGNIYPCQRFCGHPGYRLGNIESAPSVSDLLQSRIALRMKERETRLQSLCGDCRHYAYCKGGCAYNAWADGAHTKDPYCQAYMSIFDSMKSRLDVEMTAEKNIQAIAARPYQHSSHLLLKCGPFIDIIKDGLHPVQVARAAKRLIAAVELARGPDIPQVAARLVKKGIARTQTSAECSLTALQNMLQPQAGVLNNLYLHITLRCQLSCMHCYACDGKEPPSDMALESILRVLQEAQQTGFRKVILTGGEPLNHHNWHALMAALSETRKQLEPLEIVLRTNFAQPFSEADLGMLAKAVDQIVVSVDGDEATHDARRGSGSYQAMRDTLTSYHQLKQESEESAELCLASVLSSAEIQGASGAAVHEFAREFGIKDVRFRPLLPLGRAGTQPDPPASKRLYALFDPLDLLEQGVQPVNSCGLGHNLYVGPGGEAFPCYACLHSQDLLGNVTRDGLISILRSENFRSLAACTVESNDRCRRCDVRYLCGGMCKAWETTEPANSDCHELRAQASALLDAAYDYLGL